MITGLKNYAAILFLFISALGLPVIGSFAQDENIPAPVVAEEPPLPVPVEGANILPPPLPADQAAPAPQPAQVPEEDRTPIAVKKGEVSPNDIPSLLFTFWEHTAIKDARRSRGLVRAPTDSELTKDLKKGPEELKTKPPPEERDISLGGIVYVSAGDWTIWLNGKRVTPQALPVEVIDLQVFDEYVELKWFDEYTNQIFPIRLRSHQRFNIDTRIFLPG